MRRRLAGLSAGSSAAALPLLAAAQEVGDRAVDPPGDAAMVVFFTALGVVALLLIAALGYLYRRERGLEWDFQRPDEEHDIHPEEHPEPSPTGTRSPGAH